MANLSTCYKGGNPEGKPGFWLGFQYDFDTVEGLKRMIPHGYRVWDPERKLWWVSEDYDERLRNLFGNFYALIHQQGSLF